jgi:2-iminobutanoate/2-iminopropanoate deaminase
MKKIVHTNKAPKAIGPYSQAVEANGMVYCSGQISLNPETMEIVGESAKAQTQQVMKNLGEVLNAAGSSFDKVVKTTIFLANMDDFATVNKVYGAFFSSQPPARETVAVKTLPKNGLVEISCIALA